MPYFLFFAMCGLIYVLSVAAATHSVINLRRSSAGSMEAQEHANRFGGAMVCTISLPLIVLLVLAIPDRSEPVWAFLGIGVVGLSLLIALYAPKVALSFHKASNDIKEAQREVNKHH